jgi:oxygen-independent coproporphyrinogen III oxidase
MNDLETGSPYAGYLYSYPHKTAYRALDPSVRLDELWSTVDRRALFLYAHVPFCEMRCGFCNLFTRAHPPEDVVHAYLDALERQILSARRWLSDARFARFALGGGTPTFLDAQQLDRLFAMIETHLGVAVASVPSSVETSPETAEIDRLRVLRDRGVDRISIGVQTFDDTEARHLLRPQKAKRVDAALDRIRTLGFPTLNIDLMYGVPEQNVASWIDTIERALRFAPEELYLYPLYVRPLTALGRRGTLSWDRQRLELYREGRARLLSAGYRQVSMRMFQKSAPKDGPVYRCQEDGMLGLGAGARSYTDRVHYSTEYAVGAHGVAEIIDAFIARSAEGLELAEWGFVLDEEDRQRRWIILSLFAEGIDFDAYRARFGSEVLDDLPQLAELTSRGLAEKRGRQLILTERGVERSDAIGPWLCSERVRERMNTCEPR